MDTWLLHGTEPLRESAGTALVCSSGIHHVMKAHVEVKPACTCFAELNWNKLMAEKLHSILDVGTCT